jgi:RNA polymerase sigma-70 factor (ECF subfamily)
MQTAQTPTEPSQPIIAFRDALLKAIPKLRAFATSLCDSSERGDDLVQETLLKALANAGGFRPDSNMIAWLYTILRNEFYSVYRKRRREVEDDEGRYSGRMQVSASQEGHIYFLNVRDALGRLTAEHREALTMVVAGVSYDDAAAMCGCAVGTMKSRVHRARTRLSELLDDRRNDRTGEAVNYPASPGRLEIDASRAAVAFA